MGITGGMSRAQIMKGPDEDVRSNLWQWGGRGGSEGLEGY